MPPQMSSLTDLIKFARAAVGDGHRVDSVAVLAPRFPPLPPPRERGDGEPEPALGIRLVGAMQRDDDDGAGVGLLKRGFKGLQGVFGGREGAAGVAMGPENSRPAGDLDARSIRENPVRAGRIPGVSGANQISIPAWALSCERGVASETGRAGERCAQ